MEMEQYEIKNINGESVIIENELNQTQENETIGIYSPTEKPTYTDNSKHLINKNHCPKNIKETFNLNEKLLYGATIATIHNTATATETKPTQPKKKTEKTASLKEIKADFKNNPQTETTPTGREKEKNKTLLEPTETPIKEFLGFDKYEVVNNSDKNDTTETAVILRDPDGFIKPQPKTFIGFPRDYKFKGKYKRLGDYQKRTERYKDARHQAYLNLYCKIEQQQHRLNKLFRKYKSLFNNHADNKTALSVYNTDIKNFKKEYADILDSKHQTFRILNNTITREQNKKRLKQPDEKQKEKNRIAHLKEISEGNRIYFKYTLNDSEGKKYEPEIYFKDNNAESDFKHQKLYNELATIKNKLYEHNLRYVQKDLKNSSNYYKRFIKKKAQRKTAKAFYKAVIKKISRLNKTEPINAEIIYLFVKNHLSDFIQQAKIQTERPRINKVLLQERPNIFYMKGIKLNHYRSPSAITLKINH